MHKLHFGYWQALTFAPIFLLLKMYIFCSSEGIVNIFILLNFLSVFSFSEDSFQVPSQPLTISPTMSHISYKPRMKIKNQKRVVRTERMEQIQTRMKERLERLVNNLYVFKTWQFSPMKLSLNKEDATVL